MPIPRGTRQLVTLREVAERLGTTLKTVKHWWWRNRLLLSGPLVPRRPRGGLRPRETAPLAPLRLGVLCGDLCAGEGYLATGRLRVAQELTHEPG